MRALLLLAILVPALSQASIKLDMNFVPEGSARPPGDRIDVRVFFLDEEKPVELRVVALMVSGKDNEIFANVPSRTKAFQQGLTKGFEIRRQIQPERVNKSGLGVADTQFVIPFSELVLPRGENMRIGYVVGAVNSEGDVLASVPTEILPLSVRGGVRKHLKQPQPQFKFVEKKVEAIKGVDGLPVTFGQVTVMERQAVPPGEAQPLEVSVEIAGEYVRDTAVAPPLPPTVAVNKRPSGTTLYKYTPPEIFFATNRAYTTKKVRVNGQLEDKLEFGSTLSRKLHYGLAKVHIPIQHKFGTIDSVSWWEKNTDEALHIRYTQLYEGFDEFSLRLLQRGSKKDTLLFVHGYRNSFEDAVLHLTQIGEDMRFKGSKVLFTWPSAGKLAKYGQDETGAEASVSAMRVVLEGLVKHHRENGGNLFILAHSMGNRVLLMGLRDYLAADKTLLKDSPIKMIALAAPDVDMTRFLAWAENAKKVTELLTFYYSTEDWALYGSEKIHTLNRAGLHPAFVTGMDTINADQANSSFIGHTYFSASDKVLMDIRLQVFRLQQAKDRVPPLQLDKTLTREFGHDHWVITPSPIAAYRDL